MTGAVLEHNADSIVVSVPLKLKKRSGRKEVILPDGQHYDSHTSFRRPPHHEALVIAIARAYRWQKLLDEGKFESISDIAREIGLDACFAARILRLTLLAPDIVEAILMGDEMDGLSLTRLTEMMSVVWAEQRVKFVSACPLKLYY